MRIARAKRVDDKVMNIIGQLTKQFVRGVARRAIDYGGEEGGWGTVCLTSAPMEQISGIA